MDPDVRGCRPSALTLRILSRRRLRSGGGGWMTCLTARCDALVAGRRAQSVAQRRATSAPAAGARRAGGRARRGAGLGGLEDAVATREQLLGALAALKEIDRDPAGVIVHYVETGRSSLDASSRVPHITEFWVDGPDSHQVLEANNPKERQDIVTGGGQVYALAFGTLPSMPAWPANTRCARRSFWRAVAPRVTTTHRRRSAQPLSLRTDPPQRPRHD